MHDSDPTPHQDPEDRDRPEAADDPAPGARAEFGDAPRADGPEHDIDAEFAAMVEGLALPGEMQADLESVDEAGPSIISVDDVPHNTYTAPREPLTGGRGGIRPIGTRLTRMRMGWSRAGPPRRSRRRRRTPGRLGLRER